MSLPIAEDEDDEIEDDEPEHPVAMKSLPAKMKPAADRLPVVSGGEEDCFWCGKVGNKIKMKKIEMAGISAYKCERC